jgi:hypothetical protein
VHAEVGRLCGLDDGFLALTFDHGPTPDTALMNRVPRLARITSSGDVHSGPALPESVIEGPQVMVGGRRPLVFDSSSTRAGPRPGRA